MARQTIALGEALQTLEVVKKSEIRMTSISHLREILTSLRIVRGMNQGELAKILGMDRVTILRWEAGKQFPNVLNAQAWANALDLDIYALLVPKVNHDK
jgi:DNA-binding XRE family transcriptional regulator